MTISINMFNKIFSLHTKTQKYHLNYPNVLLWRFWAIPFRGSPKIPHKPFGEGGLHLQVPQPNPDDRCIESVLRFLEEN